MKGFHVHIEKDAIENNNFRKVLYTGKHSQLVLMSLAPKEEIGMEVHPDNDQFLRFEKGQGKCIIDGNEYAVSDAEELKLYTLYAPAHHKDGIVRATKAEAEATEEEFDGTTTE